MPTPPSVLPAKPRLWRKRRPPAGSPPPPVALTLTAASVASNVTFVTIQFDRAVDIAAIHVAAITVGTILTGSLYQGSGSATLVDARTVRVPLTEVGEYDPSDVKLFATAATGIVAADDGGTWAGTSGTGLPFP